MMNSSLKQCLAERRAIKPAGLTCVSIGPQASGVTVELWERENWVLPWSCFLFARLAKTKEHAELTLSFTTQTITARGQNLKPALVGVAGYCLTYLRELPATYQTQLPADDPFIHEILICVVSEKQAPSSPDRLFASGEIR